MLPLQPPGCDFCSPEGGYDNQDTICDLLVFQPQESDSYFFDEKTLGERPNPPGANYNICLEQKAQQQQRKQKQHQQQHRLFENHLSMNKCRMQADWA